MNAFLKFITQATLLLAFVIVVAGGIFVLHPKIAQMNRLAKQRNELMRKIEHKKSEIEMLKNKQQRFSSDPEFVEYVARLNKRVKPNELVFVFDTDESK